MESRGWEVCDWESFPRTKEGHDALVRKLKEIVMSKYDLKLGRLNEKEECIAWGARRGRPIFPHVPDVIINVGDMPEDRIFVEYVNTLGSYPRDLKSMLALTAVVKRRRGFVVAVRHSIWNECNGPRHKDRAGTVEPMSLKSLLYALDKEDYNYLVGTSPQ